MKLEEKIIEIFKNPICDNCAGRSLADLLSGFDNSERGKVLRMYIAFLLDSGEKLDIDMSNFYGIKFRNVKLETKKPEKCKVCKNLFCEKIDTLAGNVVKKLKDIEFDTFLVGSIPSDEVLNEEEKIQEITGIEFSEPIKSEINRELGKRIEKLTGKKFNLKNPDVTIVVDLNTDTIRTQVKSLYIYGKYQKLARGIPQTKWVCSKCNGKGCTFCKGEGKLYKTSIQEIIENPILKTTGSKKSSFHGSGREDIDARNLDWRPFVIELIKPIKRKVNLKKIEQQINKSKKVKVKGLKVVDSGKELIRRLKTERIDKTYLVDVEFKNKIDKKLMKNLKSITKDAILQKTPLRVAHRRANKTRKRHVKKFSYKVVGSKKMQFRVRAESGLYIKELITGDEGRTQPNVSELINNKVKKLSLDVIKIWTGKD